MTRFDPDARQVLVEAIIAGPQRKTDVLLVLDTGAMRTTIRPAHLQFVGLDPAASGTRVQIRSMTGGASANLVKVPVFQSLGHEQRFYSVISHDLPPSIAADGVLGLDFFRGQVLTLDFARGRISLRKPRAWWPFSR